jgi:hypothetical protein
MPVDDGVPTGLPARTCRELRQAEQDYLHDGRPGALAQADALLDRRNSEVVDATRWWLSLMRSDGLGDQDGGAAVWGSKSRSPALTGGLTRLVRTR